MSNLVHSKPGAVVQQQPTMLEAVMNAVRDPNMDPARLREFLAIGRELEADRAKADYNAAWAQLQAVLPTIRKNGLIEYKAGTGKGSPYAKWDDIHRACMPLLREHGFAVSFDSEEANAKLTVIVIITHVAGHEERRRFTVPWQDTGGSKSPAQASASARTLAQRHAFCGAFNILTTDQDDDGSGRGVPDKITFEQSVKIDEIITACTEKEPAFRLRFEKWLKSEFQVNRPTDLFQGAQLEAVMDKLQEKQEALGIR